MAFVGGLSTNGVAVLKPDGTQSQTYNEVLNVGSSTLTTLLTVTVATSQLIKQVSVSGTNIAEYTLNVNSIPIMKKRTFYGNLNEEFKLDVGKQINASDVITITVVHDRPMLGDFNTTLFMESPS